MRAVELVELIMPPALVFQVRAVVGLLTNQGLQILVAAVAVVHLLQRRVVMAAPELSY
jgi:hypothetical protein